MISDEVRKVALANGYDVIESTDIPAQGEPLRIDIIVSDVLLTYYPPDVFVDLSSEYYPDYSSRTPVKSTTFTFYDKTGLDLEALIMSSGLLLYYRYGYQNGRMTPFMQSVIVNIQVDFHMGETVTVQVMDLGDFDSTFNPNRTLDLGSIWSRNKNLSGGDALFTVNDVTYETDKVIRVSDFTTSYYDIDWERLSDLIRKPSSISKKEASIALSELNGLLSRYTKFYDSMQNKFSTTSNANVQAKLTDLKDRLDRYTNQYKDLSSKYDYFVQHNIYASSDTGEKVKVDYSIPDGYESFLSSNSKNRTYYDNIKAGDIQYIDASSKSLSAAVILKDFCEGMGISCTEASDDIEKFLRDVQINLEDNELVDDVTTASAIINSILDEASAILSKSDKYPDGIKLRYYLESTINGTSIHLTWNASTEDGPLAAPLGAKLFVFDYGAVDSGRVISFKANYSDMLASAFSSSGAEQGFISAPSTDTDSNEQLSLEEVLKSQQNTAPMEAFIFANTSISSELQSAISTADVNKLLSSSQILRYSSVSRERMDGVISSYVSALSAISFTGELVILGFPNIHYGDIVAMQVVTSTGRTHPSSGYYHVISVKDEITDGLFTTTLSLLKQPEASSTDISQVDEASVIESTGEIPEGIDFLNDQSTYDTLLKLQELYNVSSDGEAWNNFLNSAFGDEFSDGFNTNWDNMGELGSDEANKVQMTEQLRKFINSLDKNINSLAQDKDLIPEDAIEDALLESYKEIFGSSDLRYTNLYKKLKVEGESFYTLTAYGKNSQIEGNEALGTFVFYSPGAYTMDEGFVLGPNGNSMDSYQNSPAIYLGSSSEVKGISFIAAPINYMNRADDTLEMNYNTFAVYAVPTEYLTKVNE